jgi:hypothetical protein
MVVVMLDVEVEPLSEDVPPGAVDAAPGEPI